MSKDKYEHRAVYRPPGQPPYHSQPTDRPADAGYAMRKLRKQAQISGGTVGLERRKVGEWEEVE